MTFGQLQRTVLLLAVCLIAAALASAWALSSRPTPDAPVVVQVISYRQEGPRFDERWPSPPIQLALRDVRPKEESLPREHLELVREQIAAAPAITAPSRHVGRARKMFAARDPVCGSKGRRYYKKNRGMAWRCIR